MLLKKKKNDFSVISFAGLEKERNQLLEMLISIFNNNSNSYIFYYSIEGNKEDMNQLSDMKSEKLTLINPFRNLVFDDNCKNNMTKISASSYSELGNAFGGIDA